MTQDNWDGNVLDSSPGAEDIVPNNINTQAHPDITADTNVVSQDNNYLDGVLNGSGSQNTTANQSNDSSVVTGQPASLPKLNPLPSDGSGLNRVTDVNTAPNQTENVVSGDLDLPEGIPTQGEPSLLHNNNPKDTNLENTVDNGLVGATKTKWWLVFLAVVIVGAIIYYFFADNKNSSTQKGVLQDQTSNVSVGNLDSTRISDLDKIQKALEQYYVSSGKYPEGKGMTRTQDDNCSIKVLVPQYLQSLPTDPAGDTYYYGYKSEGDNSYELSAIFSQAPENVKSVETAKGFLVTLSPSVVFSSQ